MRTVFSILLSMRIASAQLTTSMWWPKETYGTDKLGFVGSVIDVQGSATTLALRLDNGTDTKVINLGPVESVTIGPSLVEYGISRGLFGITATQTSSDILRQRCSQAASPSDILPKCTVSSSPELARIRECNPSRLNSTRVETIVYTHSYSGRATYSEGVETVTQTLTFTPNTTPVPSYCRTRSASDFLPLIETYAQKREDFIMYPLVITAGLDKLNATQAASPSISSATATSPAGSGLPAENTVAAAPMKAVSPIVAGMGAALAMFL